MNKFLISIFCIVSFKLFAVNDTIFPTDTIVDPSFFNTSGTVLKVKRNDINIPTISKLVFEERRLQLTCQSEVYLV